MSSVTKFPPTAPASSTDSQFLFAPTVKKILPLILSAFVLLTLGSCRGDRHVGDVLDSADTLMFVNPDSAVMMLYSLNLDDASRFQRARYALLLTKASEKAYREVSDDSAVISQLDWLRGRGDSLETQSLFYRGVLLGYRGDYSDALVSFMDAADRAADTEDYFYRAMACREQAEIYSRLFSELPRYECARNAEKYFLLANKPIHALREKIMVADALILLDRPNEALDSLLIIRNEACLAGRYFAALNHRKLSDAYYRLEMPHEAMAHLDSVQIYEGALSSIEWSKKASIAIQMGDCILADLSLKRAAECAETRNDSANIAFVLPELYLKQHHYKEAYDRLNSFFKSEIALYNELLSHPYTTLVGQYYKNQSMLNSAMYAESRRYVFIYGIIAFLLVIAIVCITIVFRHRVLLRQERVDILSADLKELQRQLYDLNNRAGATDGSKRPSIRDFIAPHHEVFNRLCEFVARYPMSDEGQKNIGFNVSLLIKSFQSDSIKREFERFVNATADNLMKRFREQFANMSEKKLDFVLLCFVGFKNQSIYILMKFPSLGAVRTMRHRIRTEIDASSSPDKEIFLSYFC